MTSIKACTAIKTLQKEYDDFEKLFNKVKIDRLPRHLLSLHYSSISE